MSEEREEIKEIEFTIKHFPGRCCPDYDCLYSSWDKKHCRECDCDCSKCKLFKFEIKRHQKAEEELLRINNDLLNQRKKRGKRIGS